MFDPCGFGPCLESPTLKNGTSRWRGKERHPLLLGTKTMVGRLPCLEKLVLRSGSGMYSIIHKHCGEQSASRT